MPKKPKLVDPTFPDLSENLLEGYRNRAREIVQDADGWCRRQPGRPESVYDQAMELCLLMSKGKPVSDKLEKEGMQKLEKDRLKAVAAIRKEAEERGYFTVAVQEGFLLCHRIGDGRTAFKGQQNLCWRLSMDGLKPFPTEVVALLAAPRKERIYLICPVRNITDEQRKEIDDYVASQERDGNEVHYPPRDVDQDDPTGWNICALHRQAMKGCTRVDVFWDSESKGSHFDLGMAFMMEEMPVSIVKSYRPDNDGKSFFKVMRIWCGDVRDDGEE